MASALQHNQVCDRAKHGKVPASVNDISKREPRLPRVRQMREMQGSGRKIEGRSMNGRNTSTAGIWLTMFESAAGNMLMTPGRSGRNRAAIARRFAESEIFSTPANDDEQADKQWLWRCRCSTPWPRPADTGRDCGAVSRDQRRQKRHGCDPRESRAAVRRPAPGKCLRGTGLGKRGGGAIPSSFGMAHCDYPGCLAARQMAEVP